MDQSALDTNYAATGFNNRLGFGKRPALVMIDFVQAYFVEGAPLYHPDFAPSLAAGVRLKAAAQAAGIPVVVTRVEVQKNGVGGGIFFEKLRHALVCFEPGNPMGEFPPALDVTDSDILISKRYPSAFFGTPLASILTAMGVDTVILSGVSTSGCVRATCIDAVSNGFRPIIVREAVGDRHETVHEVNLYDMNAKYGDVLTESVVTEYLQSFAQQREAA
jgi:maleamate amidohydrolase